MILQGLVLVFVLKETSSCSLSSLLKKQPLITMAEHNELGKTGEQLAAEYLKTKGFEVLETNWRFKQYELDLIVKMPNRDTIVFVEVKTRQTNYFGYPETFVTKAKQKLIAKAAALYLDENGLNDAPVRFDVVAVTITPQQTHIHHIDDAFFLYQQ
jgi:putative endonuclease